MHFKPALVLAAAVAPAILVGAQSETTSPSAVPTSADGLTECILTCVQSAASSAGCSSFADLPCVCTSESFQSQATTCLQSSCTEAELNTAVQIQQANCGAFTSLSSGISSLTSAVASGASSISSVLSSGLDSLTSGTGTATSAASTDNAATGLKFAPGVIFSAAVGVVGLAAGALLV